MDTGRLYKMLENGMRRLKKVYTDLLICPYYTGATGRADMYGGSIEPTISDYKYLSTLAN
jgi:hypothetical protein